MHKALQVELQDWQRDQEPDTDHEGFYQTSLPTIITQVDLVLLAEHSVEKHTTHLTLEAGSPDRTHMHLDFCRFWFLKDPGLMELGQHLPSPR